MFRKPEHYKRLLLLEEAAAVAVAAAARLTLFSALKPVHRRRLIHSLMSFQGS
jgi:hypothetical protein